MNFKLKEELIIAVKKYNKRQSNKKYYKTHKKQESNRKKTYYKTNKESINKNQKKYYKTYKKQIANYQKKYYKTYKKYLQTPNGYKTTKKSQWKQQGLVMDNFEEIFDRYMRTTNCDRCNIELTTKDKPTKMTTKCLDHHHKTGLFRNILCTKCNWHIVK